MSNTPDSANNPRSEMLGNAPVTSLMIKFAVPSIIAMLVGALYNIVDQLFIGQAVGQLGNAATNIAFPFSTSCLSLALLFGIGGASCFNLSMGRGDRERAPYFVGNAVLMMLICGVMLMAVTQVFLTPLLKLFGSPDEVLPLAQEYVGITAWGFPSSMRLRIRILLTVSSAVSDDEKYAERPIRAINISTCMASLESKVNSLLLTKCIDVQLSSNIR